MASSSAPKKKTLPAWFNDIVAAEPEKKTSLLDAAAASGAGAGAGGTAAASNASNAPTAPTALAAPYAPSAPPAARSAPPTTNDPRVAALVMAVAAGDGAKVAAILSAPTTPAPNSTASPAPDFGALYAPIRAAALHVAAQRGHLDIIRALVQAGCSVDVRDGDGSTPLFAAVTAGRRAAADALLGEHGADVNACDDEGLSPLHEASNNADVGLVECLLAAGARVNEAAASGATPLHMAAAGSVQGDMPYRLLGLTRDAAPEEIRASYQRLALQCHPDRFARRYAEAMAAAAAAAAAAKEAGGVGANVDEDEDGPALVVGNDPTAAAAAAAAANEGKAGAGAGGDGSQQGKGAKGAMSAEEALALAQTIESEAMKAQEYFKQVASAYGLLSDEEVRMRGESERARE